MTPMPRIYHSLHEAAARPLPRALSIGNFDGVHAGHRRILRRVVALARDRGWRAMALTFDPHPACVVAPERAPRMLSSPLERCRLMAEEGIEEVLILPFDEEMAHLSPEEFVREILVAQLGARGVLVGANFHFGFRQAGDTARLAELGAELGLMTEVVPQVVLRGRVISSSAIRALVGAGDAARAARLLERPYSVEGPVISGRKIGSTKTVPTLNLETPAEVLPADGVYITRTRDSAGGPLWPSITNIGLRPTFGGTSLSIETHLLAPFGFTDPLRIRLEFLRRVRDERKFEDAESLRAQILRDVARARRYFQLLDRLIYSKRTPA